MPPRPTHLLLVEDEEGLREVTAERLGDHGYEVKTAASGEQALDLLHAFAFDIIITDLRLPGIDGREVVDAALERYPGIVAIVITGYGTVRDAVAAIKRGAVDFVAKPFQFEELLHVLDVALEARRLKNENAYLRQQLDERFGLGAMVGKSKPMRALAQLIQTVAPTPATILVTGETGTGKEMVARAIHQSSGRRGGPFVALNCSAIPETLLEAELFGHVKGAFTGAVAQRQGRLEQSDRGTLFLDEVGTMGMPLQTRLLRVLQEREFERVGDSRTIRVDTRVIAATNSDLGKMVREGTFREDLFYRLNVIAIHLPPLRERKEDVALFVRHFLEKLAAAHRSAGAFAGPIVVSQDAMRRLMAYSWPGNVRQLENAIERAVALLGGRTTIEVVDLPPEVQATQIPVVPTVEFPEEGIDLPALINQIERDLIDRALVRSGGKRSLAADLLRLKRTTLVEKLKRI